MSKSNLLALFAVAFVFSHHNALAQSAPDQSVQEEQEGEATNGNGSTWWPDMVDLLEDLIQQDDEG